MLLQTVALKIEPQNLEGSPGSDITNGEDHRGVHRIHCVLRRKTWKIAVLRAELHIIGNMEMQGWLHVWDLKRETCAEAHAPLKGLQLTKSLGNEGLLFTIAWKARTHGQLPGMVREQLQQQTTFSSSWILSSLDVLSPDTASETWASGNNSTTNCSVLLPRYCNVTKQ